MFNYFHIFQFTQDSSNLWNYMNDSFRTDVFVRFHPETIACACIYLAARQLQIPLPDRPAWYSIFNVREADVQEICLTILCLYARPRPNIDKLGTKVLEAKQIQVENKKKAKGMTSDYGTPSSIRANSPKNVSPNPTLLGSIKQLKLKQRDKDENSRKSESGLVKNGSKRRRSTSYSPDRRSSDSSPSSVRSPITKKKKHKDIESRKIKKENNEYYRNQKTSHKRKKQISSSLSRSQSQSPERMYKSSHKKYYKEKERYDYKDEKRYNDYKDRYDYKEKDHYEYSPDYRYTKRHRNGHRSSSPERYDRYRR